MNSSQAPPAPDGGFMAWLQVFLAWLAIFNTWGFVNAFGAFQTYYSSLLPESASAISWIGSVQAFLMFSVGTFTGYLLDTGHFRPTIIAGVLLQVTGIFCMSVSTKFWQLLLTQGFCTGLGGGIFFVPVMGLVTTYFERNRGLALGIVTTGTSAGGLVYPVVVQQLIDKVGFGWTVRVLGFMNVASLAAVVAGMRPKLKLAARGPILDTTAFVDVPYMMHVVGLFLLMPPVYFVFYYVSNAPTGWRRSTTHDCSDCIICEGGAGHDIYSFSGFGNHPQWRRNAGKNHTRLHSRPIYWTTEYLCSCTVWQHRCPMVLAGCKINIRICCMDCSLRHLRRYLPIHVLYNDCCIL